MKHEASLNTGQKAAAEGFFKFLFSEDRELRISGPGGYGKTYWMGYVIDETMRRYFEMCALIGIEPVYQEVVMTATTNKAAESLAREINRPAGTIHSFLNLKVKDDYQTGGTSLIRSSDWTPHHNKILFVDEAYMIDTALWREINQGTVNCKIIYVGDQDQLAPVGEKLSPICFQNYPVFELVEPIRNAGQPALMAICDQLRETVRTGIFKPIPLVPGVIELLDGRGMEIMIAQECASLNHENRIMAYTNNRVIEYNDHLRSLRQLPYEYIVGEHLINNSPVHAKTMLSAEAEIEILGMKDPEQIELGDDEQPITLEVRKSIICTSLGVVYQNIPIPCDRQHHRNLIKYFARQRKWPKYHHLKNMYPDLRQRDASTVYKAQGSTFDTVFIDLGNIASCHIPDQVARMLYVAFARARNRVFLYGELPEKYGGVIW